jgi:hypothetical protein
MFKPLTKSCRATTGQGEKGRGGEEGKNGYLSQEEKTIL